MIDLNLKHKEQPKGWEPEEIAVALIALVIWIPLAFIVGGLL